MIVHAATIGTYALVDGDYLGIGVFLFLVSAVAGFLLVRLS